MLQTWSATVKTAAWRQFILLYPILLSVHNRKTGNKNILLSRRDVRIMNNVDKIKKKRKKIKKIAKQISALIRFFSFIRRRAVSHNIICAAIPPHIIYRVIHIVSTRSDKCNKFFSIEYFDFFFYDFLWHLCLIILLIFSWIISLGIQNQKNIKFYLKEIIPFKKMSILIVIKKNDLF